LPNNRHEFCSTGIVGVGVVGGAVRNYLQLSGTVPLLYDPGRGLGSLAEINQADLVYVCVPTPYVADRGFDDSAVCETLRLLRPGKTVVIKSTVLPGTTERFQRLFPQQTLLFNPEFLREASANDDFLTPDRQIVGHCGDPDAAAAVLAVLPNAPYEAVVPASVAEMTKYGTNSFLALKVIFANEVYDLCRALGVDYELVKEGIGVDPRIGVSHLNVLDGGYRGYGGKCLPKDTMALLDLAADAGVPMRLLQTMHAANAEMRIRGPHSIGQLEAASLTANLENARHTG
jgi:UDPglucose 6-dehydrogenase